MKPLSPLQVFALNALPRERRIERLAYLLRTGKLPRSRYDPDMRLAEAREIIRATGEPWGTRGSSAEALRAEFNAQRTKVRKRKNARRPRSRVTSADYDPEVGLYYGWSPEDRRSALALHRILRVTSKRELTPRHHRWSAQRLPSYEVKDAKLGRRSAWVVMHPSVVNNGYSDQYTHKIRYLLYKVGPHAGSVRISHECGTVESAIEYLKPAPVRKAEAKGYQIVPDWERLIWRIKSPRRRKWRETPFKKCERTRR